MRRAHAILVLVAVFFVVSFVHFSHRQLYMTPMARTVVPTASSLLDGNGFEIRPGTPFKRRAPLQPMVLAATGAVGVGPHGAVVLFGCLGFAAALLGVAFFARVLEVKSDWLLVGAFALFAPYYHMLRSGMPDALVVAATFFALGLLARYLAAPSRRDLVWLSLSCGVAALTYYLALLTLLPLVALGLAMAGRRQRFERVTDLAIWGVLACGPIGMWLLRNFLVSGHLSGMPRGEGERAAVHETTLGYNALGFGKTAFLDLFGVKVLGIRRVVYGGHEIPQLGISIGLAAVLAILLGFVVWRGRGVLRDTLAGACREGRPAFYALGLSLAYTVIYAGVMLLLSMSTNNDRLYTRYISPLYFHGLAAIFWVGSILMRQAGWEWLRGAFAIAVAAILTIQLTKTIPLLGDDPGKQLMAPRWLESDEFWQRWSTWERPPPREIDREDSR